MRARRLLDLAVAVVAVAGPLRAAATEDDPAAPAVCAPPCREGETCVGRTCVGGGPPSSAPAATPPASTAPPAGSAPTSGPQADRASGPTSTHPAPAADAAPQRAAPPPARLVHDDPPRPAVHPSTPPHRKKRGFLALPYAGVHSYQHSEATGHGPGLRIGMLVGGRVNDAVSLNAETTYDRSNVSIQGASDLSYTTHEWVLDTVFSPLFRLPAGSLELVLGPKFGLFIISSQTPTSMAQVLGYTLGANVGLFMPVSPATSFGALLSLGLRQAIQQCPTLAGTSVSCGAVNTDGFAQVVGLSAAAMF
jgi:hypothetical protein